MTIYYIGITAFHHDSSVALLDDESNIISTAKEENFTGIVGDNSWPTNALVWIIADARTQGHNINKNIVYTYYENPWVAFKRQLIETPAHIFRLIKLAQEPKKRIANLHYGDHHKSHVLSAIKVSPYSSGYYMIADGVGEDKSMSWGEFNNNVVTETGYIKYPHSLGILYASFMHILSLTPNRDEWQMDYFSHVSVVSTDIKKFIYANIICLTPTSYKLKINLNNANVLYTLFKDAEINILDIPNWINTLEVVITEVLIHIRNNNFKNNNNPLIFSGGIANNSTICSKLKDNSWLGDLWIPPYPGNGGSAIGAALSAIPKVQLINYHTAFTGQYINSTTILSKSLLKNVAKRISQGQVIMWIQGNESFTHYGMGHRYFIADPTNEAACKRMSDISKKEFIYIDIIAVLSEMINNYFNTTMQESSYRTGMFSANIKMANKYKGINNINPRILSVPQSNDYFRLLMMNWANISNCDILACNKINQYNNAVNTCITSIQEAKKLLIETTLDCVVIGNNIYFKRTHTSKDNVITYSVDHNDYAIGIFNV